MRHHDLDIPAALEISRSGHGAHAWIFFSARVPALSSFDRLFPNQGVVPKGGFGNLLLFKISLEEIQIALRDDRR